MRIIRSQCTKREGKELVLGRYACHACVPYNSKWRGEGPEMTKQKVALDKKKRIAYSGIEF